MGTSFSIVFGHEFEWLLILVALVFVILAACSGFYIHRSYVIVTLFMICGLGLLLSLVIETTQSSNLGLILSIGSSLGLICIHIINARMSQVKKLLD